MLRFYTGSGGVIVASQAELRTMVEVALHLTRVHQTDLHLPPVHQPDSTYCRMRRWCYQGW